VSPSEGTRRDKSLLEPPQMDRLIEDQLNERAFRSPGGPWCLKRGETAVGSEEQSPS
jgi:hypothetical protein